MEEKTTKKKLTLSIDPNVIQKARDAGISNISEITESILRGFSFQPTNTEKAALLEKYKELFDAMKPLLKQYGVAVEVGKTYVGEINDYCEIFLSSNEGLAMPEFDTKRYPIEVFLTNDFYPPKEILSKFIEALYKVKTERAQTITELEMAKRIIEAITNTTKSSKSQSKRKIKKTNGKKNSNDLKS